ncbi:hypothetical protein HPB51_000534 [Rhipicephalus microplus]|uniref:Uncharacterized protein n=1 Tax=Rhipicephalus microplus TaxID=6941 RepID=A0A9J6EQU6_RHIMP|nr:hypothetical protein HPB51_000534 [Rhipicephalus microplus]
MHSHDCHHETDEEDYERDRFVAPSWWWLRLDAQRRGAQGTSAGSGGCIPRAVSSSSGRQSSDGGTRSDGQDILVGVRECGAGDETEEDVDDEEHVATACTCEEVRTPIDVSQACENPQRSSALRLAAILQSAVSQEWCTTCDALYEAVAKGETVGETRRMSRQGAARVTNERWKRPAKFVVSKRDPTGAMHIFTGALTLGRELDKKEEMNEWCRPGLFFKVMTGP